MNKRFLENVKKFVRLFLAMGMVLPVQARAQSRWALDSDKESLFSVSPHGGDMLIRKVASADDYYPEAATRKAEDDAYIQARQLEQAREKALSEQEAYEQKKQDAQREIAIKQKQIEETKIKEIQIRKEVQVSEAELLRVSAIQKTVQEELGKVQEELKGSANGYFETKEQLEKSSRDASKKATELEAAKIAVTQQSHQNQIDIEKMRRQILNNETEVSSVNNQKAHLEVELARSKTELDEVSGKLVQSRKVKEGVIADFAVVKQNLVAAKKSVQQARAEMADLEKERADLLSQTQKLRTQLLAEARKIELQTAEQNVARITLENEQASSEAEKQRLAAQLASVKFRQEQSQSALEQERAVVLENRLNVEKTKTEISKIQTEIRKANMDSDTMKVKVRTFASISSSLPDGGNDIAVWSLNKSCYLRKTPDSGSEKVALLKKGKQVAGVVHGASIQVMNSSGTALYLPLSCANQVGE